MTFSSPAEANAAIEAMNGCVYDGRPLTVNRAVNRGAAGPTKGAPKIKDWITVPPGRQGRTNSNQKTWDHWAGPPATLAPAPAPATATPSLTPDTTFVNIPLRSRYRFEVATLSDKDKIFELINLAYRVEDGDSGVAFKKTERLVSWDDSGMGEAYKKGQVLVARPATDSNEIVGVIVWSRKESTPDCIDFGPLAVSPSHQKKGIAVALIKEVSRIGRDYGCKFVEISVVNHRTDILPWYQVIMIDFYVFTIAITIFHPKCLPSLNCYLLCLLHILCYILRILRNIYMCVYVCMNLCKRVCMYVCMYVCMCV